MLTPRLEDLLRTLRVAAAAAALLPLAAAAQQPILGRFDLGRLRPPAMAECSLVVGCAEVGEAGTFRAALALDAAVQPLVWDRTGRFAGGGFATRDQRASVVQQREEAVALLAWAPWASVELHAAMPVVASQAGDDLSYDGIEPPGRWGTGTPLLGARWTALSQRHGAPLAAALRLDLLPPLGWRQAWAGEPGWRYAPALEVARWSAQSVVAVELGGLVRGRSVRLGAEALGSELSWGVTAAGRGRPMWAEASVRGSVSRVAWGLELALGVRMQAGPVELFLLTGRGAGPAVGTPDLRFLGGVAWSGERGAPGAAPEQPPVEEVRETP